jgi:LysR family hydrogen peroxide-inducible transcriptional activator
MAITDLAPLPYSLRQLQYAVAVAEALSFRKAAARCHVSQPSLSTQLAQLEGSLGVQLFERDRRRVLVTPAGRQLLDRARRILVEGADLLASARQSADPLAGTLRIGVIPTISSYLLPAASRALRAAYPTLSVVWVEDKTPVLVRQLESGAIEAALLALEADLGEVEHAEVARDAFVLATPMGHPLTAHPGLASPDELRNAEVLLLDDGHCFRDQTLAFCARSDVRELEFRATSLSTLAQMVAAGTGVTLLPELAVETECRRARLAVRRFAEPSPGRTIALIWRPRSPLAEPLRRIAATMRDGYPIPRPSVIARPRRGTIGRDPRLDTRRARGR